MDVKKITRTILNVQRNLVLKLHVKLISEENGEKHSFHNEYEYQGATYIRIDSMPFMTLDIIDKESVWSKDKSIMITPNNIVHIVRAMERLLDAIYGDEIFAVNAKDQVVIYKDKADEYTQRLFNIGMNQRLLIRPAKIYDHNEVEMEGVILIINTPDNVVELSIDAFESLVYNLKKIDMFTYSQLLLNYFMLQNKFSVPKEKSKKIMPKRDVFKKDESNAQGNLYRNRDVFDGLGKKE